MFTRNFQVSGNGSDRVKRNIIVDKVSGNLKPWKPPGDWTNVRSIIRNGLHECAIQYRFYTCAVDINSIFFG